MTWLKTVVTGLVLTLMLSGIPAWAQLSGSLQPTADCEPTAMACPANESLEVESLERSVDPKNEGPLQAFPSQPVVTGPLLTEVTPSVEASGSRLDSVSDLGIPASPAPSSGVDPSALDSSDRVYTRLDAMAILLREGMESLLVITALLAFLSRSGHADKSIWIWLGAGGGILASIGTAVALRVFFRSVLGDVDPDLLEGITGLVAAGLLVYVSLWLHRQSSAGAWKTYLEDQTTSVLEASNLLPLALIAFLSVYREGAETILLYVGMAPSISPSDLWSGLGMGSALLVLIAVLMLGLGLRVPLRPFFRGTSILIYLLGFKFIGNGIHNLQKVGRIPLHVVDVLPTFKKLGIYPTWETALAQIALVAVTISLLLWMRRDPSLQRAADSSTNRLR
ncbi:MAG: FTR1 family protein [Cyanophyceae cyanobacterium]